MMNGSRSHILAHGLRASALILSLPIALLVVAYAVGSSLPREHTATASGLVEAPPARVWELLTDIANQPAWHNPPIVNSRVAFNPSAEHDCWYEPWPIDRFPLCATDTGQTHRVLQTMRPSLPFSAIWTFDLVPVPGSIARTTLNITERSTIAPPVWRFIGRYILRQHTAASAYLNDVQTEALHRH